MKVLVITAAKNQQINANLAAVITAANKISSQCDIVVIGAAECQMLANLACVQKVICWNDITPANGLAAALASGIAALAKNYTHVLTAADSFGKDLLPRVAGILDVAQLSDVVAIISPNIFKKPLYAGNVLAEIESFEEIKLITIRSTSFPAYIQNGTSAVVEHVTHQASLTPGSQLIAEDLEPGDTLDLAQAKLIISGGRALGSAADFNELIFGLARKLGAAVGASRAAVEAGYASNDCQVGQTGKVVAPQVYVAIGISGAVQHLAGMKDSQNIIAINLDPNAQIFEYADFGLVADLFEVIPELSSKF